MYEKYMISESDQLVNNMTREYILDHDSASDISPLNSSSNIDIICWRQVRLGKNLLLRVLIYV